MPVRRVYSKLLKEKALSKHPELRAYLPETHPLKKDILFRMLNRYDTVFIKPDKGSQGKGIIRLKNLGDNKIMISRGLQHRVINKIAVDQKLKNILQRKNNYLIQRGIELAKYKNRFVDFRIYMQKPNSRWLISGKVVRVAAKNRFLTNYHQGAEPEVFETVLGSFFKHNRALGKNTTREIENVSTMAAKVLDQSFPGIRQLGIDIALDMKGQLWIIEVNTSPACLTFKKLKDKSMYHRILKRRAYIFSKYR